MRIVILVKIRRKQMKTMNIPGFTANTLVIESNMIYGNAFRERGSLKPVLTPSAPIGRGSSRRPNSCDDKLGECYIGCSVDYPESGDSSNNLNSLKRQGCEDSCDAAHRLCGPRGGFGGFGTVMI